MKVVHLTAVHPRYDTRIFHKQCLSLSNAGYAVTLIVADGLGNSDVSGVSICDVGAAKGRFNRFFVTGFQIYKEARRCNGRIYQFHDPELMFVGLALRIAGKIVIFDSHEDVSKQILDKPYLSRKSAILVSRFYKFFENLVAPFLSGIIAATSTIRDKFSSMNANVVDVHNFPIFQENTALSSNASEKEVAVCYVGAIAETRGIIEIVDSLAYCKSNVVLLLAGKFTDTELENRVIGSAGWEKVRFLGYLNRDGVNAVLARSIAGLVTLYPTASYVEALPVKMFEYMSAGIPVISSNIKLWSEIIEAERCGICVDPKSSMDIAKAIDYLVENSHEAIEMGARGRLAIEERYSWAREEEKLLKFYKTLLAA
jgi:glycosyltransferase involved in cell wall biosynthesis